MNPFANRGDGAGGNQDGGILIIGDDAVSSNICRTLGQTNTILSVVDEPHISIRAEEHVQKAINASHPTEFIDQIDIIPDSAIVATSKDSRNLLIVQHLLLEFDFDEIIVRVNDPQKIDIYADLPVSVVDAADIMASALVQQLDQMKNPP